MTRSSGAAGVLNHNHRVRARGHGSAGHDFNRLANPDRAFENFPGAHFADHLQVAGQIGRADGKSIAGRARKGRIIAVGEDVFGEHATVTLIELRGLAPGERSHFPQHAIARLFEAVSQIPV